MTSKVDIIKNLANKLNLIDNNDLKGGESNDLDSLIELAIEADLVSQSSYQDGGGDLDSVLELANKTDLMNDISNYQDGGDLDSVFELGNKINFIDQEAGDLDSLLELGKTAKLI